MDTNTIVTGMSMVLGAPEIMSAFNAGLLFFGNDRSCAVWFYDHSLYNRGD